MVRKNLDILGRKMMYLYIHDTLIPQNLEEMDPEFRVQLEEEKDTDNVELFKRLNLTKLCADTVGIWLKKLGFLYDVVSNNYYVDRHEKKYDIWYIHKFKDRHLLLEQRMHRWIQITTKELKKY